MRIKKFNLTIEPFSTPAPDIIQMRFRLLVGDEQLGYNREILADSFTSLWELIMKEATEAVREHLMTIKNKPFSTLKEVRRDHQYKKRGSSCGEKCLRNRRR
jgi:hypothetical protein